jgi:hypothetical protein
MRCARVRVTDLQISKEELVVRHIGKDAIVLYEFKKPHFMQAS